MNLHRGSDFPVQRSGLSGSTHLFDSVSLLFRTNTPVHSRVELPRTTFIRHSRLKRNMRLAHAIYYTFHFSTSVCPYRSRSYRARHFAFKLFQRRCSPVSTNSSLPLSYKICKIVIGIE